MKKKIKRFLVLIILGIVVYLVYSNRRISGTWIGIHRYNNESDSIWKISHESILNFSYLNAGVYEPFISDKIHETPFVIFGNTFLNDFTYIKHLDKDSLVFSSDYSTFLYRKVHDSLKQKSKIEFEGKLIELKHSNSIDTVYFTSRHLLWKNAKGEKFEWSKKRYKLVTINDFQFLVTDNGIILVIKEKNKQLFFYKYWEDSINTSTLKEIILNDKLQKQVISLKKVIRRRDSIHAIKYPHQK